LLHEENKVAVSEKEALAGLRILVCVAKSDGLLHPTEREALISAFAEMKLPAGVNTEHLLTESNDFKILAKEVISREARERIYESAYGLAFADGECSPQEKEIIEYLAAAWVIEVKHRNLINKLYRESRDTFLPSNIMPILDPVKRAAEIREDVLKYSAFNGALGVFPVPVLAIPFDIAVYGLQRKMVRDIGQYWGYKIKEDEVKSLFATLGIGTGIRIAVTNLVKFVPGWGSALGAATSFATTFALGRIADKYFERDMKMSAEELKKEYAKAKKDGEKAYEVNKGRIEAERKAKEAKLKVLAEDFNAGKFTKEEYERKVADMV
jgi:uncharacterized protein (DUF697 family)/tellurite resistance protein